MFCVFSSLREALDARERELEQEVEEMNKILTFSLNEEQERSRVWQGQFSLLGECVEEMETWVQTHAVSSENSSQFPPVLTDKSLMVDVCLLQDALRSALSSSQATCSYSMGEGRKRVSELPDQIKFSFFFPSFSSNSSSLPNSSSSHSSSPLSLLFTSFLYGISHFGSVSSTSTISPSFWSVDCFHHVFTCYTKGKEFNQVDHPISLTYSSNSKLFYVTDSHNNRIQTFQNNPIAENELRLEIEFLPPFGQNHHSISLKNPSGICFHEGLLFIVDNGNHRVLVCREEDGSVVRTLGTTGNASSANGQFDSPFGCTVHDNHLFVSELKGRRIQKFSLPDLTHVLTFGFEGQRIHPCELLVFHNKLYVTDVFNHRLSVFDPDTGRGLYVIGPFLSNGETLSHPRGLLVSHNRLFVSSQHCISIFDHADQFLHSFGSKGIEEGQFSCPSGMVMVGERLFVCEMANGRIQVFEHPLV